MIDEENGKRKMDGRGKFLGNFSENEVHTTTGNGNNMYQLKLHRKIVKLSSTSQVFQISFSCFALLPFPVVA